ncbi:hypothetical protein BG842_07275 [Haladaptatus sp. W1]|uniref:DUF7260 family protein n=1 Tax=Haladaptatus sp. W1 TaxID=1897478 RepID=UPI000849A8A7|nr:hypothetical protein [Haladaptatus sp. W1]ODR79187.1 hypothetical protein BG842_07275 [Haladaptatus sp. W1]
MSRSGIELINRTEISEAQQLIEKEESQVQAEADAFEDFLDRLDKISPHPYQTDGGGLQGTVQSQSRSSPTLQGAIQTAYRETVLSVSHWEDEYGKETVLESLGNEFGPEVAAGVAGGSATWSQLLMDQLQDATKEALESRQQTFPLLIKERKQLEELCSSLAEIGTELAAIERGEYSFAERSDRLTSIQERLDVLTHDQQAYLRRRKRSNKKLFTVYLYADLDADYPGLAALATARRILDRIELRHWAGLTH